MNINAKQVLLTLYIAVLMTSFILMPASVVAQQTGQLRNGYFLVTVEIETGYDGVGTFTVATDENHPSPGQDVLYDGVDQDPWSSYMTLFLPEQQKIYVQTNSGSYAPEGYTVFLMDNLNPVSEVGIDYVKTTWRTPEGLLITQEIILLGDTLNNSLVEQRVTVSNAGDYPVTYGLRYMWDIMIDGEDGSVIRLWNSTGPMTDWLYNETEYNDTSDIMFWQTTNDENSPIFYIWGSLRMPAGSTPPDRFVYAAWPKLFNNPWFVSVDPNQVIVGDDTGVAYYWTNTLNPGESTTYRQFLLPVTSQAEPPPAVTTTVTTTTPTTTSLCNNTTVTTTVTTTETETVTETEYIVETMTLTETQTETQTIVETQTETETETVTETVNNTVTKTVTTTQTITEKPGEEVLPGISMTALAIILLLMLIIIILASRR